jgi:hypothetical protein
MLRNGMEVWMDVTTVANIVASKLKEEPAIQGAFLHHSVAGDDCPDSTYIHISIVSKDTLKDLRKAYGMYEDLLQAIGQLVYITTYEQGHSKGVRALFGRTAYPPVGLNVHLSFCQLKHVTEQDVCASCQLLFDHTGAVKEQLMQVPGETPAERLSRELAQQLQNYPFHLHDATQALAQKDRAGAQSAAEQMRQAVYFAAAVRAGQQTHCAERGWQTLAPGEKWVLENTFQAVTLKNLERLTTLYLACLSSLQTEYNLGQDVERFKQALPELI